MIFITVGTHEAPFDRLVRAADQLASTTPEEVILQRGYSRVPAPHCTVRELLPPTEVEALVAEARVVVTHAGPASVLLVESRGKVPVVVPRRAEYGEHVDNHQVQFARRIRDRIQLLEDPLDLASAIEKHSGVVADPARARGVATSEAFSEAFGAVCQTLIDERRTQGSFLRATVAALLQRTE